MSLDDPLTLARVDPHDARRVLQEFPAQCRRARTLRASPAPARRRPRLVVVAGMGGSAGGGDLLAACAAETVDVPIIVHRGYGLPAAAGPETLTLLVSYSGDTAEAISAAEAALARKVPAVVLTAGGALDALAAAHGLPRVALPPGLMPRMALGYLVFPALAVLAHCGVVVADAADVDEALDAVAKQAEALAPTRPTGDNEAKGLALAMGDRWPAVYGGPFTGGVAYRWKTDFEENAKTLALAGAIPEMNHNEIEAWRAPAAARLQLVLLRDGAEAPDIARRFTLLRDMAGPVAGGVSEAWTRGRGRLARLLSLAYLGQWTSYYLAVARGVDPWTIDRLTEFKRRLQGSLA